MNRNYYCKVNSQEQAGELLKTLSIFDEKILTTTNYIKNSWNIIGFYESNWCLLDSSYIKKGFIEVPASELIDYVTGKKVDKDALLEEPKVETKFEVGKWYKINNCWYAKLKAIHSSGKYWQHSEVITSKGDHRFDIGDLENTWKDVSIALLEDLSEIQQYLPEGHPDLIKEEFVLPEKWCVKVTDENKSIIHKWKVENTDCSTFTRPGYYVFKEGTWASNISDYTEITFDQFKKYVLKDNVKEEAKAVEEWGVGSYAVALKNAVNWYGTDKGDIYRLDVENRATNLTKNRSELSFTTGSKTEKKFKWFPTLQEAQKFSDELLGKSKTSLSRKDLIDGEFYKVEVDDVFLIMKLSFKSSDPDRVNAAYISNMSSSWEFKSDSTPWLTGRKITKADYSEVKWLNTCIKQDKFIHKEDLDKYDDFGNLIEDKKYPEYVECINIDGNLKVGNIYKVIKCELWDCESTTGCKYVYYFEHSPKSPYYTEDFKPSTKSAYEAQFKKDEKFKVGDVLYIMGSKKNRDNYPQCIGTLITIRSISEDTYTPDSYWISYTPERFGGGGYRVNGNGLKPGVDIRKALPHEIPVENSVKQNPLVFEECGSFPGIGILEQLSNISFGAYQSMNMGDFHSYLKNIYSGKTRKSPDLIDKSKVEVKIKRTKVKQIKL